jgi:hypothetical protein
MGPGAMRACPRRMSKARAQRRIDSTSVGISAPGLLRPEIRIGSGNL